MNAKLLPVHRQRQIITISLCAGLFGLPVACGIELLLGVPMNWPDRFAIMGMLSSLSCIGTTMWYLLREPEKFTPNF